MHKGEPKMKKTSIYNDIAKRTDGDIYVGVVGPVKINVYKAIYGHPCDTEYR